MSPPIAILGAGPSGLTLARLLELNNIDYAVFERDESADPALARGGTLDLHTDSGLLALKEAGLLDEFKLLGRQNAKTTIADMTGKVHVSFAGEGDADRPEIDRRDLRAMLARSVPQDRIRWGSKVERVQKDADGSMSVHLESSRVESGFRLVVGADGAWSKARSLVTSAKPQYAGMHFLTASIKPENPFYPAVDALVGKGNYMALGEGKQVNAQELGDGSYFTGVCLRLPEFWATENRDLLDDPSKLRQTLLAEYFANWPKTHRDLIEESEGPFRAWPLYAMPTESLCWETVPGVTLIGDAAHVTTPFMGEGVNTAMLDSLQLAQQIVKHGLDDLNRALSEYEKAMFPRGIELIQGSQKSGELLFAPDSPRSWLKEFAGIESA